MGENRSDREINIVQVLAVCREKIADKFMEGNYQTWRNEHYVRLSKEIFDITHISVSADTLKRLFGRKQSTLPQISTREAIALYLGYKGWGELVKDFSKDYARVSDFKKVNNVVTLPPAHLTFGACIAALAIIITYIFYFFPESIEFGITNISIGKVPHLASYRFYNKRFIKSDSFCLDLGYKDELFNIQSLIKLHKNVETYNESYQIPGKYTAKVIIGNKILDSTTVYAIHNEWIGLVGFPDKHPEKVPVVKNNSYLTLDSAWILKSGFLPSTHYLSEFRYFNIFSVSGDNLIASAKVENNLYTGGKSCYDIYFVVECNRGKILVQFVEPGCEKFVKFIIAEQFYDGRYNNMSQFGHVFNQPHEIRLATQNGTIEVTVNQKLVTRKKYKKALGNVIGVRAIFKGIGRLYFVEIRDTNSGVAHSW